MKFRVTAITGQEEGRRVSRVTLPLQEGLNARLATADFGSDVSLFVILFVTAFDDPDENRRWARGQTKLGRAHTDAQGVTTRIATVGVPLARAGMKYLTGGALARVLVQAATQALADKPAKVAAGLDWPALVEAVLSALAEAAAHGDEREG